MKLSAKASTLLATTLVLAAATNAQRRTIRPISPPKAKLAQPAGERTALLVLMENGGIRANFADCKVGTQKLRLPKIPVASCGSLCLALNPGESIPQLLRRAARILAQNRACTNPARWRVEMLTFEQWFQKSSDFLLEELVKSVQMIQNAKGKYGKVVVLDDAACKPNNALAHMNSLARQGYLLDIHVLTHGGKNVFLGGGNARFDEASFFSRARAIRGLKLRSVYQMNCVSGTLIDEWQKLGAKVVNGTYGEKNNYMPQGYFHFSAKWLNGSTFYDAVMQSYQEARFYTEPVYRQLGLNNYVPDSRQRVVGDRNCRLVAQKAPLPITKVPAKAVEIGLAAACAAHRAAKRTAQQAIELLMKAGHELNEVADEVMKQYSCSVQQMATYLQRNSVQALAAARWLSTKLNGSATTIILNMCKAGFDPTDVAKAVKSTVQCSTSQIAKALRQAGCSTRSTARALKQAFNCNAQQVATYLRQAGSSVNAVADALRKELNCSVSSIAKYLRQAGCSANSIAKALREKLNCSTNNVAKYMKSAGCSFNQIAKAIWAYSSKSASSLNSLIQAMVSAFNQNVAQVASSLAKLGIRS